MSCILSQHISTKEATMTGSSSNKPGKANLKTPTKRRSDALSTNKSVTRSGKKFRINCIEFPRRATHVGRVSISPPLRHGKNKSTAKMRTPPSSPESTVGTTDSLSTEMLAAPKRDAKMKLNGRYRENRDDKVFDKFMTAVRMIEHSITVNVENVCGHLKEIKDLLDDNAHLRFECRQVNAVRDLNQVTDLVEAQKDDLTMIEVMMETLNSRAAQYWLRKCD